MNWNWYLLTVSVLMLAYTWLAYPLLLWLLRKVFARPIRRDNGGAQPFVSIIVAAHNEAKRIAGKVKDCLNADYPRDRLEIVVACDGCTDATEQIVSEFAAVEPRVRLLGGSERRGKSGVQNVAVAEARGEILFFTDANTSMPKHTLQMVIENFADPEVGAVTVAACFGSPEDAVSKGQGMYWRYELFLRAAESDLGILATGSGQALAVRRCRFRTLPPFYGDDCIIPLDVRLQGCRVVQEQRVEVYDTMPHSVDGELRARARMTTRNWTGTFARSGLLNPFRFPLTSVGLVSHKLLRWLTPFFLMLCLVANTLLVLHHRAIFLWVLQILFYTFATIGWQRTRRDLPAWIFGPAFSFCLANIGFFLGMVKVLRQQRIVSYRVAD
jgi:cellulose synthase/poly-beta-1,6-N-acetylglucosamine synthase-like glycosyltransferase